MKFILSKINIYNIVLITILSIHFLLIITGQCYDQGWNFINNKFTSKINENYITPYFEQNWCMFAPTPPQGNEYIAIRFHTAKISSPVINIHEKIKNDNFKKPFSLDQRTIKYLSECYSDVLTKHSEGNTNKELMKKSNGILSILNYSKIVLLKQKGFLNQVGLNDTINVDLYLINEPLSPFNKPERKREQFYTEIKNLYLTKKTHK